jgi:hypothetical protein
VNAVIFLGIVLMWAVVLVPMWLKRHDETEETRSVDKFSTAMHTLSRRESSEKQYVVMPRRNWLREVHVSGASAAQGVRGVARMSALRGLMARRSSQRRELSAAQRRRRTLTVLLVATVLTVVLALAFGGALLWTFQILVDLCLVGFVAHLRRQARNAAVRRPVRRPRPAPRYDREDDAPPPIYTSRRSTSRVSTPVYEDEFEPVAVQHTAPAAEAVFDQTATADTADRDLEPVAVGSEPVFDQADVPAAAVGHADVALTDPGVTAQPAGDGEIDPNTWQPVPVPRPTYASKPPAPPRRRRAPTFEPVMPADARPDHELHPVDDLEEILDRRWAVND